MTQVWETLLPTVARVPRATARQGALGKGSGRSGVRSWEIGVPVLVLPCPAMQPWAVTSPFWSCFPSYGVPCKASSDFGDL